MTEVTAVLEGQFIRDPNVVSRLVAGEFLLVPVRASAAEAESIFALNEVGGRIWELLDGERTLVQIRDQLLEEFEVTEEQADAEFRSTFLTSMRSLGLVTER